MGDRLSAPSHHNTDLSVAKLKQTILVGRWLFTLFFWLTLGSYSLWSLRFEFELWQEHLTWAVVRYGLIYNPFAALALVICVANTCAVLVWHSKKILQGWSAKETYRLEQEAKKIAQNPRYWLWFLLKKI